MPKFQVVSDIDGTVFPTKEILFYLIKQTIPNLSPKFEEEYKNSEHYKLEEFFPWAHKKGHIKRKQLINPRHIIRKMGNSSHFINVKPYSGAKELFDRIYELNGINHFLTERGKDDNLNFYYDNGYEKTKLWLNRFNLKHESLVFSHNKTFHIKRLEKLYKLPILVNLEDSRDNAVKMAKEGQKVILIKKPYNKLEKDKEALELYKKGHIFPVKDLFEAREKIEQLAEHL